MVNDLDYEGIESPVSKKDYNNIEQKNNICINVFYYEYNLIYPVYVSNKKFENCMDLLLITDGNKSHYVRHYTEALTDICVIRQRIRIKNAFANIVYNVLVVKKF